MTGLRAELSISAVESCPVAAWSVDSDDPLTDVTWTADGDDETVERFDTRSGETDARAVADGDPTVADGERSVVTEEAAGRASPETVFDDGTTETVEFDRDWDDCVCEQIESVGCPVDDVRAVDGRLLVQFRVRSNERLREVIAAARTVADDVRLNYVVSAGEERSDAVLIDRGELTDRQREVLETAYAAGYFAHPRETNAESVAATLDISASTFREHLATAQSKLLGSALDG